MDQGDREAMNVAVRAKRAQLAAAKRDGRHIGPAPPSTLSRALAIGLWIVAAGLFAAMIWRG